MFQVPDLILRFSPGKMILIKVLTTEFVDTSWSEIVTMSLLMQISQLFFFC